MYWQKQSFGNIIFVTNGHTKTQHTDIFTQLINFYYLAQKSISSLRHSYLCLWYNLFSVAPTWHYFLIHGDYMITQYLHLTSINSLYFDKQKNIFVVFAFECYSHPIHIKYIFEFTYIFARLKEYFVNHHISILLEKQYSFLDIIWYHWFHSFRFLVYVSTFCIIMFSA